MNYRKGAQKLKTEKQWQGNTNKEKRGPAQAKASNDPDKNELSDQRYDSNARIAPIGSKGNDQVPFCQH